MISRGSNGARLPVYSGRIPRDSAPQMPSIWRATVAQVSRRASEICPVTSGDLSVFRFQLVTMLTTFILISIFFY